MSWLSEKEIADKILLVASFECFICYKVKTVAINIKIESTLDEYWSSTQEAT